MRLYLLVLAGLMAVGATVLSMPVDGQEVSTTAAPATSSRPKREDGSDGLCCGAHTAKREASCCGGESPKPCCGQGADEACCGSQSQADMEKTKREAAGGTNDTCCGKDRVVRAAATTTAKPEVTTAPAVAPARFAREENKSCCGVEEAKVDKPKREADDNCCGESGPGADEVSRVARDTSDTSCCGESSPNKARVSRDVCCGLKDDEAKKCCGAEEAAPGKSKRCTQTTPSGLH